MLKKLNILIILLLTTLQIISQTDTNDSIICLPKTVLVKAIQDIESGDLAKEQLILERSIQEHLQQQLEVKDTIINTYIEKETSFSTEINLLNEIIIKKDEQVDLFKKQSRKYLRQRNIAVVGGVTVTLGLSVLFILNSL
tara:strand:+ start:141 stop:560 length:420 start_codon:yes stop_codon:yes gene_type:complete